MRTKKPTQELIEEVPRSNSRVEMTIGIDVGDVWSHYCTLNEEGEVSAHWCIAFLISSTLAATVFVDGLSGPYVFCKILSARW